MPPYYTEFKATSHRDSRATHAPTTIILPNLLYLDTHLLHFVERAAIRAVVDLHLAPMPLLFP